MNSRRRWLVVGMVLTALAVSVVGVVKAQRQSEYLEDFDDGEAQGWALDEAWAVEDGILFGGGQPGEAVYTARSWTEERFSFRLKILDPTLRVLFRITDRGRYYVDVARDGNELFLTLYRQEVGAGDGELLGRGVFDISNFEPQMEDEGLLVEVIPGEVIEVWIAGQPVVEGDGRGSLPEGFVGFAVEDGWFAAVDDVRVSGLATGDDAEQAELPDLFVGDFGMVGFNDDFTEAILEVVVVNGGPGGSPPVSVIIEAAGVRGAGAEGRVSALAPGEEDQVEVRIPVTDELAGREQRFVVEVDPDNVIAETSERNNRFESGAFSMPPADEIGEERDGNARGELPDVNLPILIAAGVLAAGLLGGGALAVRGIHRRGRREKWKKQAEEKDLPESCTGNEWYVKVEPEVTVKGLEVPGFDVELHNRDGQQVAAERINGEIGKKMQQALAARWVSGSRELQAQDVERLEELSVALGERIKSMAENAPGVCDIGVSVRLDGLELTQTYTVYRCKKGQWEEQFSWEESQPIGRSDDLSTLAGVNPIDGHRLAGLGQELAVPLRHYVEQW